MTKDTTSTPALGYSVELKIDGEGFTNDDFRAAFDETLGRNCKATKPKLNAQMAKLMKMKNIHIPAIKGNVNSSPAGVWGAYNVQLESTVESIVESIESDIEDASHPHGLVMLSIYTAADENPTHYFSMAPDSQKLNEIDVNEYYMLQTEALGFDRDE